MAERYGDCYKDDIRLRFRVILPNGDYAKVTDPTTLEESIRVDRLTPDEVERIKKMGYGLEQVEPEPDRTRINLSQTTHDKE